MTQWNNPYLLARRSATPPVSSTSEYIMSHVRDESGDLRNGETKLLLIVLFVRKTKKSLNLNLSRRGIQNNTFTNWESNLQLSRLHSDYNLRAFVVAYVICITQIVFIINYNHSCIIYVYFNRLCIPSRTKVIL